MAMKTQSVSFDQLKTWAKRLSKQQNIALSEAQKHLAMMLGYADWHACHKAYQRSITQEKTMPDRVPAKHPQEAIDIAFPKNLHPKTQQLVRAFAGAMAEKLEAAERKYGYSDNWAENDWMPECRQRLREHMKKGGPEM